MLTLKLSSIIILYSIFPLIFACSWISRTGNYRVSVSDVAFVDGFAMIYIPSGSATLFGSIYDGNGNLMSTTVIKTLPSSGQGTIQVQGLIDGTFAICIQDMSSFPYYEIRSTTFDLISGPTTLVSDITYQCLDIATFGPSKIVFQLKSPTQNYFAYTYYVSNTYISSITTFWPPFEVLRPSRTGFCNVLSSYSAQCTVSPNDMSTRGSSGWTLPDSTEFNFHLYYPAGSTTYELLIYGSGGVLKAFMYIDKSPSFSYNFNIMGSIPTYFSSAVSPATGYCLFCWYNSPSVNCYMFDVITGNSIVGATTLTQPEALTNISVTSLSSGKFLVSLWSSSNFYFTFFGSSGICSSISTNTGCAGECGTCLNLNQLRFCGYSTLVACTAGYYPNYVSNICLGCPTNCSTCTNSTYCLSCNNSNYLTPSYTCSTTCPSGYFPNTTSARCIICPTGCATCNSPTNCLTCSPLYYTYNTSCVNVCPAGSFLFNNVCNTTCPSGYFGNSSSNTCMACPANCSTSCYNTSACISCTSGYYLLGTICLNNTCPTTYRPVTGQCQSCISGCDSCSDGISCNLCSASLYWNNASCLGTCPSYAFPNITSRSCMNCTNNCSSCISYTNCSSCNPGYYFLNNTCLSTCPLGYYANTTTKTCSLCLANCENCNSSTSCNLCNLGTYLLGTTCYQTNCPLYYRADTDTRKCLPCISNCETCVDNLTCSFCALSYYYYSNNQSCLSSCPNGFYPEPITRTCNNCHSNCSTCSNYTNCSSCNTGFYLYNNLCLDICPFSMYGNSTIRTCKSCLPNCDTCSSDEIYSTCSTGYFWNNVSCSSTCPIGFYANDLGRVCSICLSNCSQCTSLNNCSSCNVGYYHYSSSCLSICPTNWYGNMTSLICQQNCAVGYLPNPNTNLCDQCTPGCSSCTSVNSCYICLSPFNTSQTACPCPAGSRLNTTLQCSSISFINLEVNYTASGSFITITSKILEEELTQPSNINFKWDIITNSSNSTIVSTFRNYLRTQNSSEISINYSLLEPYSSFEILCSYINLLGVNISNTSVLNLNYLNVESSISNVNITQRSIAKAIRISYISPLDQVLTESFVISVQNWASLSVTKTNEFYEYNLPGCFYSSGSQNCLEYSTFLKYNPLFKSTTKSFCILVDGDSFTAQVINSGRNHPYNYDLELNSSIRFNGYCPDTTQNGMMFTWSCSKSSDNGATFTACSDSSNLFGVSNALPGLIVPKSYYQIGQILKFQVTASKDGYSSEAEGLYSITGDKTLILSINCMVSQCRKYNSNSDLILKVLIINDPGITIQFRWNISANIPFQSFGNLFYMNGDTSSYQNVQIQVTVDDSVFSGKLILTIPVNSPPNNGTLISSPSVGASLSTEFIVTASQFIDSDLPMTYQFFYYSRGDAIPVSEIQSGNSGSTILSGNPPSEIVTFMVTVMDVFGASSNFYTNVTVNTPQLNVSNALNNLFDVAASINTSNPYKLTSQTSVMINQLSNVESSMSSLRKNITFCTGCPNGENICQFGTCLCLNSTGSLVDCTITQNNVNQIITFKDTMINNLNKAYENLPNNTGSDSIQVSKTKESILSNIKLITNSKETMATQIKNKVVDFLDNSVINTSPSLTVGQASQTTKISSNLIGYIANEDCNCTTSECKSFGNKTTQILNQVSASMLKNRIPGQSPLSFTTDYFDLVTTKVSICDLNTLKLKLSADSPEVSFEIPTSNLVCTQYVNVQVYTFPQDLFSCKKDHDTTKDIVMVNIVNGITGEQILDLVKVILTMPLGAKCPGSCSPKNSECVCEADALDISGQMNLIFKSSNINAFNNINALQNWDWLRSPIFWVNVFLVIWMLISMVIFKLSKSASEYCIVNLSNEKELIAIIRGFFTMFLVLSDVTSLYVVNSFGLSKAVRTIMLYVKLVFYSTFAAIFADPNAGQDFTTIFKNLNFIIILLPYFTVIPLIKFIKFLVIVEARRKKNIGCASKIVTILITSTSLIAIGGCLFAMFVIAANKNTQGQLSWLFNFLVNMIQDSILNPFVGVIIQILLIKFKVKTVKYSRSFVRNVIVKRINQDCETVHGKMARVRSFTKIYPFNSVKSFGQSTNDLKIQNYDNFNQSKSQIDNSIASPSKPLTQKEDIKIFDSVLELEKEFKKDDESQFISKGEKKSADNTDKIKKNVREEKKNENNLFLNPDEFLSNI